MLVLDKQTFDRGERVRVAVKDYAAETTGFEPLKDALVEASELTDELNTREGQQNADTTAETKTKDEWREVMARKADTLSKQAVPWGAVKGGTTLKLKLRVTYADLRYGPPKEDVDVARGLVALVRAIPTADQALFRISAALATELEDAAKAFEDAKEEQTGAKLDTRLATLSMPELGVRLRAALALAKLLVNGQKDVSTRWAELAKKFNAANKIQKLPGETKRAKAARVVKKLTMRGAADEVVELDDQNYAPLYEIGVENLGTVDLRLWMGLEPGGKLQGAALTCPAGMKRTFRRAELGPETARRLMGQFVGAPGGEAKVVVRRVVKEE